MTVVLLVSVLSSGTAGAAPPPHASPDPPPSAGQTRTERYPAALIANDVVAVALGLGVHPLVGVPVFVFGGPVIHAAKGNGDNVGLSFAVRAGGPTVGVLLGIAIGRDNCKRPVDSDIGGDQRTECIFEHALALGMLGLVSAIVVDYAVLAKKTVPDRDRAAMFQWGGVAANPTVSADAGGVSLGLVGRF